MFFKIHPIRKVQSGTKTLNQFHPGQSGIVLRLVGEHHLKHKLSDMGITPDTKIMVRRIAPLGDPIEISLRGYELSLRKSDAQTIEMKEG